MKCFVWGAQETHRRSAGRKLVSFYADAERSLQHNATYLKFSTCQAGLHRRPGSRPQQAGAFLYSLYSSVQPPVPSPRMSDVGQFTGNRSIPALLILYGAAASTINLTAVALSVSHPLTLVLQALRGRLVQGPLLREVSGPSRAPLSLHNTSFFRSVPVGNDLIYLFV